MKDKVFIKNLFLPCNVGVSEEERAKKQNVIVDIEIQCDLNQAGAADDLNKTINYYEIKERVAAAVTEGEFKLLESLAENVSLLILKDPIASKVVVAVKKEKYAKEPIMGIEITRDRHG